MVLPFSPLRIASLLHNLSYLECFCFRLVHINSYVDDQQDDDDDESSKWNNRAEQ